MPTDLLPQETGTPPAAPSVSRCRNCGRELSPDDRYCHHCGQKVITGRVTLKELLHQGFRAVLSLEKGLLFTTRELACRPGHVVRDYLSGRTVIYYNPLKYMIFWLVVGYATTYLNNRKRGIIPSMPTADGDALERWASTVLAFWDNHQNLFLALMVVMVGIAARLVYRRHQLNWAEHAIALSYVVGLAFAVEALLYLLSLPLPDDFPMRILSDINLLLLPLIMALTYGQLLRQPWWRAGLNAVLCWVLGFLLMWVFYFSTLLMSYGVLKVVE